MTDSYFSQLPELTAIDNLVRQVGVISNEAKSIPVDLLAGQPHLAIQYLTRAANEEHSVALDLLGMLYATGQFLPKDPERAVDFFKKSAKLNDAQGCFHLAMAQREGFGCPKNLQSSFAWLRVASHKGDPQATFALAQAYEKGLGCEVNQGLAIRMYVQAANRGEKQSIERLIKLALSNDPPNFKEVLKWLKKASDSMMPIGLLAMAKKNLEDDPSKIETAFDLLEEGARQTDYLCCLELCSLWIDNRFAPKDIVSAIVYCHMASTHGSWLAQNFLEKLRTEASGKELRLAAELASYPTPSLVVYSLKQRRLNLLQ